MRMFKRVGRGMYSHELWRDRGYAALVSKGLKLELTDRYFNHLYPNGPCGGCGQCFECNIGGCEACFHGVCETHEGGML